MQYVIVQDKDITVQDIVHYRTGQGHIVQDKYVIAQDVYPIHYITELGCDRTSMFQYKMSDRGMV